MEDHLRYDFGDIYISDRFMIGKMVVGTQINEKHNLILKNLIDTYFENKPFVYISLRVNNYKVDPSMFVNTSKIKNLMGGAVVSNGFEGKKKAEQDFAFLEKPFRIFDTIEEAKAWGNSLF
ncbi:MAG: hypothetical protein BM564_09245 [Bacteroidetes bacterium MedPE-SWsnd-G2]|nr:MAG: hypothetical protein BM564_09245 [Bacteroidetes bacterium MedPE-SWsnd-G2]